MKFTILLSFFALAESLTIPAELADGAYIISIDADGKQIMTELGNINTTSTDSPANNEVGKRAIGWPSGTFASCPGGNWFRQDEFYDHAYNLFYNSCKGSGTISNGRSLFVNCGTSKAYMCSYGNNPCAVDEWAGAVDWIAGSCNRRDGGYMEPAHLHIPGWKKIYGYATQDVTIC